MESQPITNKAAVETFVLQDLNNIPESPIPYLCEVWNWQGDTSVLPYKWTEVLNSVCGIEEAYDIKPLKANYVASKNFDPNAFFFITYRSHAIGLCLAWPTVEKEYEVRYLCSVPSQRDKGVEESLISLVLTYCKNKQATKVTIKFDEANIYPYQSTVLKPILLTKFNFVQQ